MKEEMMGRMLYGMDAIEDYVGRNKQTVRKWIERDNFPAVKVDGRWESNTLLIDEFRKQRIKRAVVVN